MCYGITNSGEGAFSRTGAFNFVKRDILGVSKKVRVNREYVMAFFKQDGDQFFLVKSEDETRTIAHALRLKELNADYFKAKTDERHTDASRIRHDILAKLNYSMNAPKEQAPYFVK